MSLKRSSRLPKSAISHLLLATCPLISKYPCRILNNETLGLGVSENIEYILNQTNGPENNHRSEFCDLRIVVSRTNRKKA
jgi:hypothetical protein